MSETKEQLIAALVALTKSERSGVAMMENGIDYCTHCYRAAPDIEHAPDCPIVAARILIETLAESEKET